jgi:hypothetical protein
VPCSSVYSIIWAFQSVSYCIRISFASYRPAFCSQTFSRPGFPSSGLLYSGGPTCVRWSYFWSQDIPISGLNMILPPVDYFLKEYSISGLMKKLLPVSVWIDPIPGLMMIIFLVLGRSHFQSQCKSMYILSGFSVTHSKCFIILFVDWLTASIGSRLTLVAFHSSLSPLQQ